MNANDQMNDLIKSVMKLEIGFGNFLKFFWTLVVGLLGAMGGLFYMQYDQNRDLGTLLSDNQSFRSNFELILSDLKDVKKDTADLKYHSARIQELQKAAIDEKEALSRLAILRDWSVIKSEQGKELIDALKDTKSINNGIVVFKEPQIANSVYELLKAAGYNRKLVRSKEGFDGVFIAGFESMAIVGDYIAGVNTAKGVEIEFYSGDGALAAAAIQSLKSRSVVFSQEQRTDNFAVLP